MIRSRSLARMPRIAAFDQVSVTVAQQYDQENDIKDRETGKPPAQMPLFLRGLFVEAPKCDGCGTKSVKRDGAFYFECSC